MAQTTLTRGGYCTHPTGHGTVRTLSDKCQRKATKVVTDPSRKREVCTQHAKRYESFGPQRDIAAAA